MADAKKNGWTAFYEGQLEEHLLARKEVNQRLLLSHWTKVP